MKEENFNVETVSFEIESTGNGTVLKCINAGEDVELVSTWFAREEDAKTYKSFLEYMANAAIHSVNFTEEQRDALVAERDVLKAERDELSAKLDVVKDNINNMFAAISVDKPSTVKRVEKVVEKEVIEEKMEDVVQGEIVSFESLSKLDQARYYKVLGYNGKESMQKVKGLQLLLLDSDNPNFMELCTDKDFDFIKNFGGPLFDSTTYMSSTVRSHAKHIVSWLSSNKLSKIKEDLQECSLNQVAEAFSVHPAYIWAICVCFNIPFVNDNIPDFNFTGLQDKPGNKFTIPFELEKNSHKVHLMRACKILGYTFDETGTLDLGNLNRILDVFQLNWRKLGTDEDVYSAVYCDTCPFEDGDDYNITDNIAVHKYLLGYMDEITENVYDWGIDRVAEALKVPIYYIWAFCTYYRINFTAKHRKYNAVHAFIFEESE